MYETSISIGWQIILLRGRLATDVLGRVGAQRTWFIWCLVTITKVFLAILLALPLFLGTEKLLFYKSYPMNEVVSTIVSMPRRFEKDAARSVVPRSVRRAADNGVPIFVFFKQERSARVSRVFWFLWRVTKTSAVRQSAQCIFGECANSSQDILFIS